MQFCRKILSLIFTIFPEFSIKLTFGTDMDQSLLLGNYYAHSMYLFWWGVVLIFGIGYYLYTTS